MRPQGAPLLLIIMGILLAAMPSLREAATARGPSRSYRGEARRRRSGMPQALIGGQEEVFEGHKRTLELRHKVKELANKGTEFVFDSKEKVDAVFRCTACKRVVSALSLDIVGRLQIGRPKKKAKGTKRMTASRGKIRMRIRALIESICSRTEIMGDKNTVEQCPFFIKASAGSLEDMFLDRCDPEDEFFEEDVDTEEVCRSTVLTDEHTCPPGVLSMEGLLAKRINENQEADQLKAHEAFLEAKKEKRRKARAEEDSKLAIRLKKEEREERREIEMKNAETKEKKKNAHSQGGSKLSKKKLSSKTPKASGGKESRSTKLNKEEKKTPDQKRTRTIIRKIRRVRRVPRRNHQQSTSRVLLEYDTPSSEL